MGHNIPHKYWTVDSIDSIAGLWPDLVASVKGPIWPTPCLDEIFIFD